MPHYLFYVVGKPFRYLSFDWLFPRIKDQFTAKNKAIGQLKNKYLDWEIISHTNTYADYNGVN